MARKITILGNNMLSGQNGFYFDSQKISLYDSLALVMKSANDISSQYKKNKLTILKDYNEATIQEFAKENDGSYIQFQVQPTMILEIRDRWQNFEQYYDNMKKKYRARVRTARKKLGDIQRKELDLEELKQYEEWMHHLYMTVADNADFNTFYLPKNHFYELKKHLGSKFCVIGYFLENKMVGFFSIIFNYKELDTYFLGYEDRYQKPRQLYLNMLLDIADKGIENNVIRINYGRTAIEIKSTIGAEPVNLYGLMRYQQKWINKYLDKIFDSINLEEDFIPRSPFHD